MFPRSSLPAVAVLAVLALPAFAQAPEPPGFGIPNATRPEEGLLITGQPTAKQLKAAAKAGYRTVIDLRPLDEDHGFDEEKAARKAKLEYTNIAVTPDTLDAPTIKYFMTVLSNAQRPALIHCSSGNRAAGLYYAWLVLENGMPENQAMEQAQAAGLSDPELGERIHELVNELKASRRPKP
ncbi:MAG TPA: sulfur transferase domain-containing protein [Thermoanaerobaculia bacterium]|nr:sulfur transferase domain-containing protein [Thermoanaerobaculia bacterium]